MRNPVSQNDDDDADDVNGGAVYTTFQIERKTVHARRRTIAPVVCTPDTPCGRLVRLVLVLGEQLEMQIARNARAFLLAR